MREVFALICAERKELGLVGELAITFRKEMIKLSPAEIIGAVRDCTNSLSPYAERETEWGSVRLRPVAVSQEFEPTRLYSPDCLKRVFDTDLELDEFDGICAVAANAHSPVVERAELPLLLKWTAGERFPGCPATENANRQEPVDTGRGSGTHWRDGPHLSRLRGGASTVVGRRPNRCHTGIGQYDLLQTAFDRRSYDGDIAAHPERRAGGTAGLH